MPLARNQRCTLTSPVYPISQREPANRVHGRDLFLGKQFGVFDRRPLSIKPGLPERPSGVSRQQFPGASVLAAVGLTSSLFIAGLAFEHTGEYNINLARSGILTGSFLAAMRSYLNLRLAPASNRTD